MQLFYLCPYFILARLTLLEPYSQFYNNIAWISRIQWRDNILYFQNNNTLFLDSVYKIIQTPWTVL